MTMSQTTEGVTCSGEGSDSMTTIRSREEILTAALQSAQALGYNQLKEKQVEVVEKFLSGHDIFGVLPTGYGKSLCYACLPGAFDRLSRMSEPSIVIIITPLVSIMKDKVFTKNKIMYIANSFCCCHY